MLRSSDLTILCTSFLLGALMHSRIYSQSAPLVEEVVASPQVVTDERIPLLLRIPASVIAKSVDRDFHHTSPMRSYSKHSLKVCAEVDAVVLS